MFQMLYWEVPENTIDIHPAIKSLLKYLIAGHFNHEQQFRTIYDSEFVRIHGTAFETGWNVYNQALHIS